MATLARIHIHPIKSFDPQSVSEATVLPSGALDYDRRFGILDANGFVINGKQTPLVHRLRSHFDRATRRLTLRIAGKPDEHVFHMDDDREALKQWLAGYFDTELEIYENPEGGWPDDPQFPGPTVISTASLEAVASWYPDLPLDNTRDRFRANLEIGEVEPFWEDRLLASGSGAVRFRIGEVEFLGMNPCARCVVPSRDPQSGDVIGQFAKTFADERQRTLPSWAPADRFDHFFRLAVNTRAASESGGVVRVGDTVEILGSE